MSGTGRPRLPESTPTDPLGSNALGNHHEPAVSIDHYAPRKSWWPLLIGTVAVLVAALIWASTTWRLQLGTPTKPTATPIPTAVEPGLPFVSGNERYSGSWEVLHHQWNQDGVEVELRITVKRGPLSYGLGAFQNTDLNAVDAHPSTNQPRLSGMPIETGTEEVGWVFLPVTRGDVTLILTDGRGNQMSALPIPG